MMILLLSSSACSLYVDSTDDGYDVDPGDGACATETGDCTVRAAIMEADASSYQYRIVIPPGFYEMQERDNNTGERDSLIITKSMQIQGAGKEETTISGQYLTSVFRITGGQQVEIQSLTVQNGESGIEGGGGMWVENANTILTDVKIFANFGRQGGGGLKIEDGASVIGNKVEISGNLNGSDGPGSAIWNLGQLELVDSLIHQNEVVGSGAIVNDGILKFKNVTVSENTPSSGEESDVGAIQQNGSAVLENVTLTGNISNTPNGTGGIKTRVDKRTVAVNSLFSNNWMRTAAGDTRSDCSGAFNPSSQYNLIQEPGANCTYPSVNNMDFIDPRIGNIADNGGPTLTYALMDDSPAIDAGSPAQPGSSTESACSAYDQRGVPRPQSQVGGLPNAVCDIGAYESGNLDSFVERFILVDADTNGDIRELRNGDILELDSLPANLTVRAEGTNANAIDSMTFNYDDRPTITEGRAPYALGGDNGGDYLPFEFGDAGRHTLRATPFSENGGTGSAGGSLAITIQIIKAP